MEYLQPCIDLRRQDIEPEMFTIAEEHLERDLG